MGVELLRHATVLPVRDVPAALDRLRRMGFATQAYDADVGGYGFATRGQVELHVTAVPDLDPAANLVAVYLFCDDAAGLHAEWAAAGLEGALHPPEPKPWGLDEGIYVDPEGTLFRYGSRTPA